VISTGGSGLVVWAPAFFDEEVGQQVHGARILGGRVNAPEVLRPSYFSFTHAAAFGRDRVVLAGSALRSGTRRAAVTFGTTTVSPLLGRTRSLPGAARSSLAVALAGNRRGAVAIVYSTCPDRRCAIRELSLVERSPGAAFGRPVRLGRAKQAFGAISQGVAVDVNARGDTLAVWEHDGNLRSRLRTAAGRARRVERLGRGRQSDISAALGDDRAALVAWGPQRFSVQRNGGPFAAFACFRPPGQRFGPAQLLERRADARSIDGTGVRATITARHASVAHMADHNARFAIRSRDVTAAGFGPAQTLSSPGEDARLIDVAALDSGEQVAIWKTGANVAGQPGALVAATRAPAAAAYGSPETIDPNVPLSASDVALNPATGQAWATWSDERSILVSVRSPI